MPYSSVVTSPTGSQFTLTFEEEPTQEDINFALDDLASREQNTGQSEAASFGPSFVKGALGLGPSVMQGVGALVPGEVGETIREGGQVFQSSLDRDFPTNPVYQDTFTGKAGSALGQGAAFLAGAMVAPPSAVLTVGGLAGAAGGAQVADELGLEGGRRFATTVGFGLAEAASERMFGIGTPDFLKETLSKPLVAGVKAIAGEAIEEPTAGFLQDTITNLATIGTDKPAPNPFDLTRRGEEALYGAIGAGPFGVVAGVSAARQPTILTAQVNGKTVPLPEGTTPEQAASLGIDPKTMRRVRVDPSEAAAVQAASTPGSQETLRSVMLQAATTPSIFDQPGDALQELAEQEEPLDEPPIPETTDPAVEGSAPLSGVGDLGASTIGPATGSSAPAVSIEEGRTPEQEVKPDVPVTVEDLATSPLTAQRNINLAEFRRRIKDPNAEPSPESASATGPPATALTPAAVKTRLAKVHRMGPAEVRIINRPELRINGWLDKGSGVITINAPYIANERVLDEVLYHEHIHRAEYDPTFKRDIDAAMVTFPQDYLDSLDDLIAREYELNEIPTERAAVALSRAAIRFREQSGFKQIVQRVKTWFKQQFGRPLNDKDAEAIAMRIIAKAMRQAREGQRVVTQKETGNVRREGLTQSDSRPLGKMGWEDAIKMQQAQGTGTRFWTQETIEDFSDREAASTSSIMNGFNGNPKGKVHWPRVSAARLKRIWLDFGKTGVIRDEKGLDNISNQILNLITRLHVANVLSGHDQIDPSELLESHGYDHDNPMDDEDLQNYLTGDEGEWFVSDYGLPHLYPIYQQILKADTPEDKLYAIDRALNVVHQRGDLANMFVEGGSKTLTEIANQTGEEGQPNSPLADSNTEVTLTATNSKGNPVEITMPAQDAEAMLTKRQTLLQALLDCLET